GGAVRRGGLLDDLAHPLLRELIELVERAVARVIGGNGERVVPAAVRVGEEVISGLQVAIASGQVEAEVPDRGLAERGRGSARLAGGQGVGGGFRRGASRHRPPGRRQV